MYVYNDVCDNCFSLRLTGNSTEVMQNPNCMAFMHKGWTLNTCYISPKDTHINGMWDA